MHNHARTKWKFVFGLLLFMLFASLYESATVPEIIAPTHPMIIALCLLIADVMIVIGAYLNN